LVPGTLTAVTVGQGVQQSLRVLIVSPLKREGRLVKGRN
jgi:hypothetical protein